ncbi:hypothetical protein ACFLSJ_00160 [Verrucomicrobiota bacterium]
MVVLLMLIPCLACCLPAKGAEPRKDAQAREGGLAWKCVWVWGLPGKTEQDAVDNIELARSAGFSAFALQSRSAAYRRHAVSYGREHGVEVYMVLNPVYGEWGWRTEPGIEVPETCLQEYPTEETDRLNNPTHPDDVAYPGPWLCIDRPEVRRYAAETAKALVREYRPTGIALDFVGYKNYSGCRCPYSARKRPEFAAKHPGLSDDEVERDFSLTMLRTLYEEVRSAVKSEDAEAKLMCHVYPPFNPRRFYGNRLPVEYPCETVAWFFKPHWPIEAVAANCAAVKQGEHKHHDYVTATGFIGLDMDAKALKTPERLRAELRAIKESGLNALCIAGGAAFLKDPNLTRVLSQELAGSNPSASATN